MEGSSSAASVLSPICAQCFKNKTAIQCACWTTYYCSKECQNLNWKEHRIFCHRGEGQDIATQRQMKCLRLINTLGLLFSIVFKEKFYAQQGFVFAYPNTEPTICPLEYQEESVVFLPFLKDQKKRNQFEKILNRVKKQNNNNYTQYKKAADSNSNIDYGIILSCKDVEKKTGHFYFVGSIYLRELVHSVNLLNAIRNISSPETKLEQKKIVPGRKISVLTFSPEKNEISINEKNLSLEPSKPSLSQKEEIVSKDEIGLNEMPVDLATYILQISDNLKEPKEETNIRIIYLKRSNQTCKKCINCRKKRFSK